MNDYNKGFRDAVKEIKFDLRLARECLNYQLIKCKHKDCLNQSCPLNRKYDKNK